MIEPMDPQAFERIMNETILTLPPQFQDSIKDVIIVIQPEAHTQKERRLLGLYEGVPVTAWGRDMMSGRLPDKITLFKDNIEAYAFDEAEVPHIIRETLLHEIAHHFGFGHDVIGKMEKRWKTRRKDAPFPKTGPSSQGENGPA
jgi:predicted Zn-dependent protease with MMP-like domain